jgi:DNA-binding protein YbaB
MNGEQKVQTVEVDKDNLENIERDIQNAVGNAVEKSQKVAAEVMKDLGGLGLPGM